MKPKMKYMAIEAYARTAMKLQHSCFAYNFNKEVARNASIGFDEYNW